jgi:asparagine synthetase B (glutamine-hydrolysing)
MQMVSDVPIGAFLSGGIDSGAVLAFMARASSQPVRTYSIGFDGGPAERFFNELPHARAMAERFGTEHHEILVRPDVVGLLPKLLWHMDEPIADSASSPPTSSPSSRGATSRSFCQASAVTSCSAATGATWASAIFAT